MFFEDRNGNTFPVARIKVIGPVRQANGESAKCEVVLEDDSTRTISYSEAVRIEQMSQIVPALPGFYLLHPNGKTEAECYRAPVIAWAVGNSRDDSTGHPVAITPDGVNDSVDSTLAVLAPDGSVMMPGLRSWKTLQEFLDEQPDPDD